MTSRAVQQRSVAVVGMACRLPGARHPEELWELLRLGGEAISDTPAERYDAAALCSPHPGAGQLACRRAGHLDGIEDFDAEFFGFSAAEAAGTDPQQRLLLMTAWEALEDAGLPPRELAGSRTGVFVGNSRADFLENQLRRGLAAATAEQLGNVRSLLPARLSHVLDLRGPSIAVDTACSSSLTAVHQAVLGLRAGESPVAVVAGVNLALRPDEGVMMSQAGAMSADGRSRFGSRAADGHAPADAIGVVVLRPLADALRAGDRVRAVIEGSAVGNDGRTTGSVLRPSPEGQLDVLRGACADAGLDGADVDYVEAHGAGSPLSDPVELAALAEAFGPGRRRPLPVGSVKSNIGHSEAAGGLVGLIKTVLCLEHRQVPPSPHAEHPREDVDWSRLQLPDRPIELPERAIAGVSAQGSSSLNAHVLLRAFAEAEPRPEDDGTRRPLVLSARTPEALADLAAAYRAHLRGPGAATPVRDICRSAALRRTHFAHRMVAEGSTHAELVEALSAQRPVRDALARRYLAGQDVDWARSFGPGGHVGLPTYPWRLRRCSRDSADEAEVPMALLREHARVEFEPDSALSEIGIDSLAKLRLMVQVQQRTGHEVDPEELSRIRTVGELCEWARASLEVAG